MRATEQDVLRWTAQGRVAGTVKSQSQGDCGPLASHSLTVELPIPPGINSLYCNVPGKGRVLTRRGREYKQGAVSLISGVAMQRRFKVSDDSRLSVSILWHFRSERSDIDGPVKALIDCIAEALGFNDRRVKKLTAECGELDAGHPRCVVTLTVI